MSVSVSINEHSSIRLQGKSRIVYCDPFHIKNETHDADIILITHEHYDHFSPEDIKKLIKADTVLVAPLSCQNALQKAGFADFVALKPLEFSTVKKIPIEARPAYNEKKPFHPQKNEWLGYVITLDDEVFYIAGDTDAISENRNIRCDTLFVPVGGTYTMDVNAAVDFSQSICPKRVIPTHYGSVVGSMGDGDDFEKRISAPMKAEKYIK